MIARIVLLGRKKNPFGGLMYTSLYQSKRRGIWFICFFSKLQATQNLSARDTGCLHAELSYSGVAD